jgi:hypothetical protein
MNARCQRKTWPLDKERGGEPLNPWNPTFATDVSSLTGQRSSLEALDPGSCKSRMLLEFFDS